MKIIALDLETTGLNPETCEILELGAIFDDTENPIPIAELPRLRVLIVKHSYNSICYDGNPEMGTYKGEPYAIGMHAELFREIARVSPKEVDLGVWSTDLNAKLYSSSAYRMATVLNVWAKHRLGESSSVDDSLDDDFKTKEQVVLAGKNVANFDLRFLRKIESWEKTWGRWYNYKIMDHATVFAKPSDKVLPSLNQCLQRAGLPDTVTHHALDDAEQVVRLARHHFGLSTE